MAPLRLETLLALLAAAADAKNVIDASVPGRPLRRLRALGVGARGAERALALRERGLGLGRGAGRAQQRLRLRLLLRPRRLGRICGKFALCR